MKSPLVALTMLLTLLCGIAAANTDVMVVPAELSASFEAVPGRVVLAGEQLLFWSESPAFPPFYIAKEDMQRTGVSNNILTVETKMPVRILDGMRSRFDFRLIGEADAASLERWFAAGSGARSERATPTGTAPAAASSTSLEPVHSYNVKHKRMFGDRTGKLIFTRDAVIWESLDNAAESRTWKLESIRRLERKNPYEVVVDPFSDDKYTFQMTGSPLSDEEYNWITNRLAQVRSSARE